MTLLLQYFHQLLQDPLIEPVVAECKTHQGWFRFSPTIPYDLVESLSQGGVYYCAVLDPLLQHEDHNYVGQSQNIWQRWNQHLYASNAAHGKFRDYRRPDTEIFFMVLEFDESERGRRLRERDWQKALSPKLNLTIARGK
jgi:hypothetical protein